MRSLLLAAIAAGLAAAPVRAADVDKYLPEDAGLYIHITTKNFLASDVVRKAIPMAFDKFGDDLLPLIQLAKQFNPNAPDVPEDAIKQGIGELKKPETIAKAFDAAKDFGPEIIVTGNPDAAGPESALVIIKCSEAVKPELIEGFIPFINNSGQAKVKSTKVGKTTVYELSAPTQPQPVFAAVPEAGIICIGVSKTSVESAVKAASAKVDPELKGLMGKRADKDFLFVAAVKGKGADRQTVVGSLVLDKDISAKVNATFGSAQEAKEKADELTQHLKQMTEGLKGMLGDKAKDVSAQLDKMKATVNDKTVSFDGTIPGAVVEKLLAKDK